MKLLELFSATLLSDVREHGECGKVYAVSSQIYESTHSELHFFSVGITR